MSFALPEGLSNSDGVAKMSAMPGSNSGNVDIPASRSDRTVFSELLSETLKNAAQLNSSAGTADSQQAVGIFANVTQGNIVHTGNAFDLAIEGDGYFVLNDGSRDIYNRSGAFAVDGNRNLVDPGTSYVVQRIGSVGEADGFQIPGDSGIKIPYGVVMAGKATSKMRVAGNLSADEIKNIDFTIYDSEGDSHVLSAVFVPADADNTWDMILSSGTGDVSGINPDEQRVRGIEFNASDGSYASLNPEIGDSAQFVVTFANDTSNPQTISISMGTPGQFDGLTQFAGNSTAAATGQDGYESGSLSSVAVNNEGVVVGTFSNGIKKNIAAVKLALFQNDVPLEGIGGGYFVPSAGPGQATATQALIAGAGSIHGGALEKSNADIANEFVGMIQAQNGFQANAKTIRTANDVLQELSGLFR